MSRGQFSDFELTEQGRVRLFLGQVARGAHHYHAQRSAHVRLAAQQVARHHVGVLGNGQALRGRSLLFLGGVVRRCFAEFRVLKLYVKRQDIQPHVLLDGLAIAYAHTFGPQRNKSVLCYTGT